MTLRRNPTYTRYKPVLDVVSDFYSKAYAERMIISKDLFDIANEGAIEEDAFSVIEPKIGGKIVSICLSPFEPPEIADDGIHAQGEFLPQYNVIFIHGMMPDSWLEMLATPEIMQTLVHEVIHAFQYYEWAIDFEAEIKKPYWDRAHEYEAYVFSEAITMALWCRFTRIPVADLDFESYKNHMLHRMSVLGLPAKYTRKILKDIEDSYWFCLKYVQGE